MSGEETELPEMTIDTANRVVTWEFSDISLPPNENPPEGEGNIVYTISPKENLGTGTEITAQASIVFDVNEPIITNEYVNTIDKNAPTSAMKSLDNKVHTKKFEISWHGNDGDGVGVSNYEIYVSKNNQEYELWQVTDTTALNYKGENRNKYSFYVKAQDSLNHTEDKPAVAETSTEVKLPEEVQVNPNPYVPSRGHDKMTFFGAKIKENSKINIYNKAGEHIIELTVSSGKNTMVWKGRNESGNKVASGIYFYRLKQETKVKTGKMILVR